MTRIALRILCSAILLAAAPALAQAATLSVSTAAARYTVGDSVVVDLNVSSDVAINAVGATVTYSPNVLQLMAISKTNSVLTFWAEEPHYSQSDGTAAFQGVAFNPGWSGANGRVVEFIFRAMAPGTADLNVKDGQVLANDGKGTDVLTAALPAEIQIDPAKQKPATSTPVTTGVPPAGVATSTPVATSTATSTSSTSPIATTTPSGSYFLFTLYGLLLFLLGWLVGRFTLRRDKNDAATNLK